MRDTIGIHLNELRDSGRTMQKQVRLEINADRWTVEAGINVAHYIHMAQINLFEFSSLSHISSTINYFIII